MSNNETIVSLDIGTSKVRAIIGEINNGSIHIVGVGSAESEGIRKGAIVNIDQTVQSIRSAIDHAERMVGIEISGVYVGITGSPATAWWRFPTRTGKSAETTSTGCSSLPR